MSRIREKLKKMASNDSYNQFVSELSNVSDDLERVLKEAKNNEEIYSVIMNDDELLRLYTELLEINKAIGFNLMGF